MCGVIGVVGLEEAAKEVFLGLVTLQHRGQDAAGILTYNHQTTTTLPLNLIKDIGLVESVFAKEDIEILQGAFAIGHTRYSTIGKGSVAEVQPLVSNYPYGIGIVHNGNIVNYLEIKERLENELRVRCLTSSDTEAILHWLSHNLKGTSFQDIKSAVKSVFENIQGSYSVVGLIADAGLIAFRDPHGIRPLLLGEKIKDGKKVYMVASESSPMTFLGYEFIRDLEPGEVLFIDRENQIHTEQIVKPQNRPCMFEWVYFASAESRIESAEVHGVRLGLGKALSMALKTKIDRGEVNADVITPIPDTARPAATAIAEELAIPYRDVLIKNRYITRTFILGSQSKRKKAVDLKLHPIASELKDKNVILVDDSIVRGTTSRKLVQLVRNAGAKSVTFVSTCPPIKFPCFYGIDFPDSSELIAGKYLKSEKLATIEKEVAAEIGADAVVYLGIDELSRVITEQSKGKVKKPCMACLNGEYMTATADAEKFTALRKNDRILAEQKESKEGRAIT